MDKYTIYCTEEQTRKALELGAPIKLFWKDIEENFSDDKYSEIPPREDELGIMCEYAVIPTAEQMINWLDEQNILIEIARGFGKYAYRLLIAHNSGERNPHIQEQGLNSRKEATLAAIDTALDYLNNKTE